MSLRNGDSEADRKTKEKQRVKARAAKLKLVLGVGQETPPEKSVPWEPPVPLARETAGPPFPTNVLPPWLRDWVDATATATQTPADLAGMMGLSLCGAALARRFDVTVRTGWSEPLNLFTCTVLPPGERKSEVFKRALCPVQRAECEQVASTAASVAAAASKKRVLEQRVKSLEGQAAKAAATEAREKYEREAALAAEELAGHVVAPRPQLYCDDVTPEKLTQLLVEQGGRMLQASAEGTAFEIAKGRYSETANFDVYLKGHSGDPLRTGRIGRGDESVDRPALSVALSVQPDVVRGLVECASMRGRGFLARFLYSIPGSKVGSRRVGASPVPPTVAKTYQENMLRLWNLKDGAGLSFSPKADGALADFERRLEPQLADGQELAALAGWANKLAGAVARVAGILHVAEHAKHPDRVPDKVGKDTVQSAISLGKDYLLPHALAAFGLMGADPKVAKAKAVLASLPRLAKPSGVTGVTGVSQGPEFEVSRREVHRAHQSLFPKAEDMDPVLELLERHGWLRPTGDGKAGRGYGYVSPKYRVHPLAMESARENLDTSDTSDTSDTRSDL